ncbi:MAG: Rpn family recombination-promoting nuclease/putative transposase [Methylococcaceae bacterium]|nr:MAG: Rpn family recombination-promoting nuclease/putative transposase [Methylococcaceae bacterium]
MKHPIDPKIDCVFKALLGSNENRNLLIHFLNAFLAQELSEPLIWVDIINPYNDKEFFTDKLSIVDVKAKDSHDQIYQIEIQLTYYAHLPARIIYNWADIYSQQLQNGQAYRQLRPTYSIWLIAENLLPDDNHYSHHYKMRDEQGRVFNAHGGIWLFELKKFHDQQIEREDQRWIKFFNEGERLNDNALPEWMNTQIMRQAMATLTRFSEKEDHYYKYQARQEYLREQLTIQLELEATGEALLHAQQREQEAKQREQEAMQREQEALAEIERLHVLLRQ